MAYDSGMTGLPRLSVSLFALAMSAPQERDAKAIEAAQNTNVRQIEPSLPSKPFAQWLRDALGTKEKVKWEVNDCGEQTGNPTLDRDRDFPMCAEAQAALGGERRLSVSLSVGTFKTGVRTGPATFVYAVVIQPDGSVISVKSLSGLSDAIRAVK